MCPLYSEASSACDGSLYWVRASPTDSLVRVYCTIDYFPCEFIAAEPGKEEDATGSAAIHRRRAAREEKT